MKHSFRAAGKVILLFATFVAIAIIAVTGCFIYWMFAHGFHDVGQFLLKLKAA